MGNKLTNSCNKGPLELIFLGGIFPQEDEPALCELNRVQLQFAANHFQLALLEGFTQDPRIRRVTVINAPFVGSWPRLSRIRYFQRNIKYNFIGFKHHPLPFWNLFALKQVDRLIRVSWAVGRYLWPSAGRMSRAIVVYSAHTPFLWGAILARSVIRSSVPIWLVLPDLPEYFNLSQKSGFLYRILKGVDVWLFRKACKKVDAFAVLTEAMLGRIQTAGKPSLVIEGIYRPAGVEEAIPIGKVEPDAEGIRFLYTGGLFKAYGVELLISAFRRLEHPAARLYLAGTGESIAFIQSQATLDPRIHYLGQLPSCFARAWQQRVDFLVNPRCDSGEFTRYSFPSKIIEYFASGTPTIMCPLSGVPDEYRRLAIMTANGSEDALLEALREACSMPALDRSSLGAAARDFVLTHKSPRSQCDRLLTTFSHTVSRCEHSRLPPNL